MYSTSTGAAVEKAPEPELEQHFYRRVRRSWSSIFINDSSGAASDLWLLQSPGWYLICIHPVLKKKRKLSLQGQLLFYFGYYKR